MSIVARDVTVTQGASAGAGEMVAVTLPDREPGDSLYVFYASESQDAGWEGSWTRSGRGVASWQSGAVFSRLAATGDARDDLTIEIADGSRGYTIIAVATVGRTYLQVNGYNAQTAAPGGVLAPDTFTADYGPNPANRVLHFLSAENPTANEMPSAAGELLGSGIGEWYGAAAGLWLVNPADAGATLHLPERTASFWLTARLYQAVVTYADGAPADVIVETGPNSSVNTETNGFYFDEVPTETHGVPPDSGISIAAQEVARDDSSVDEFPAFTPINENYGMSYGSYNDTDHLPGEVDPTHWYRIAAAHNRRALAIQRRNLQGSGFTEGVYSFSPNSIAEDDRPAGVLGWEWEDGTGEDIEGSREAELSGVVLDAYASTHEPFGVPADLPTALVYQTNELTWTRSEETGFWSLTGFTPAYDGGVATLGTTGQNINVDIQSLLDENGDVLLWHLTPATEFGLGGAVAPLALQGPTDTTGPDQAIGYGHLLSNADHPWTVTWTFTPPAFRWIVGFDEITEEAEVLETVRRHPVDGVRRWPPTRARGRGPRRTSTYP